MGVFIDLTGQKFGRLTVIKRAIKKGSNGETDWHCVCDCGEHRIILSGRLRSGITKSCGCYSRELARIRLLKHNLSTHPIYTIWAHMRVRCYSHLNKQYARYGGRGIKICDEWKDHIDIFYKWCISHGWNAGLQIDRIDNNRGYSPDNCRFVTNTINCQNQSRTKFSPNDILDIRAAYENKSFGLTHREIAVAFGVHRTTITDVINRRTWDNI